MNRMNKKTAPVIGVFLLLGALIISSCDHFYSTSWGTPRKYDPKNIKLDAGNVDSWKETAVGNPELAAALTEKIKDELKGVEQGNPNKDQAKLQDAGVSLAIEASGVGTTIVSNAGSVIDKIEQLEKDGGSNEAEVKETVKELFEDIQGDFKSNNGSKAADNL
ncbi:MAG: hypothetical protein LBD48_11550, partial [Treponema sp.]|nr:hypothetical protein [Treponema sp.]